MKTRSGEHVQLETQEQWIHALPKLAFEQKTYRLYVHVNEDSPKSHDAVVRTHSNTTVSITCYLKPLCFFVSSCLRACPTLIKHECGTNVLADQQIHMNVNQTLTSLSAVQLEIAQTSKESDRCIVNMMKKGNLLKIFVFPTQTSPTAICPSGQKKLVFFQPCMCDGAGQLYYVEPNSPKTQHFSQRLCLDDLEQLIPMGPNLASTQLGRCMTLVTSSDVWCLEAECTEQLVAWMRGLHIVLTSNGCKLSLQKIPAGGPKSQLILPGNLQVEACSRFLVEKNQVSLVATQGSATLHGASKRPRSAAERKAFKAAAVASKIACCLEDFRVGRTFAMFARNKLGQVCKRDVFIFYEDLDPTPMSSQGSLYWCQPGSRVCVQSHSLPLENIRLVVPHLLHLISPWKKFISTCKSQS